MMKAILLCNSDLLAFPAIFKLQNMGVLLAVAIPEKVAKVLTPVLQNMGIPLHDIHILTRKDLEHQLTILVDQYKPEAVLVLTFPWKIPSSVLQLPTKGFINFHFGLLPVYQGTDPVFWQLNNGEPEGGISIHIMTDKIDEGPIITRQVLPMIPGETYGIHCQRLGALASEIIFPLFDKLNAPIVPLNLPVGVDVFNCKSPALSDITIQWDKQTANEIERLVNATNPKYGGAVTTIRNMQMRILEVSAAQLNNTEQQHPGTIVYADALYGIIVSCINGQYLKVNIVQISEGYLSGGKLFSLGFSVGEVFS